VTRRRAVHTRAGRGRTTARAVAAVVAAALLASACSSAAFHGASAGSGSNGPGLPAASSPAADSAGGTRLTTFEGTRVRVPGSKPTVLAFISVSCADCTAAAKALARASQTLGRAATVLGVDVDPGLTASEMRRFLDYVGAKTLPVMIDSKLALMRTYAVSALSTVLVVNPAGRVTFRAVNPSPGAIEAAVDEAS
jgi:thiol-disulfide isomerase/thioredoxin